MRRSLILILLLVVVLAAGIFIVWLMMTRTTSTTINQNTVGSLPQIGTQIGTGTGGNNTTGGTTASVTNTFDTGTTGLPATRFGVISDEPVLQYYVDGKNDVTAVEPDGKIATITNGQATFLNSTVVNNLISANFSYDGAKVLVNFGDAANPQTSIFTMSTKAWTPLAAGIISPMWSPNDYRIAYLQNNADGTKTIQTLDTSKVTSKPSALVTVNLQDISLLWPTKNQIVLSEKPSAYVKTSFTIYDLAKKIFSRPISPTYGLETTWSGTTSSIALAIAGNDGGRGGTLFLSDPATSTIQNLTFLTMPSKCVFHYEVAPTNKTATTTATSTVSKASTATSTPPYLALYCAAPKDPSVLSGSPLPDAYEQTAIFTADSFVRMHTNTGALEDIFSPSGSFDGTNLKVFNNVLFFVNRYDQKLYAISLAPAATQ